jgi:transposase
MQETAVVEQALLDNAAGYVPPSLVPVLSQVQLGSEEVEESLGLAEARDGARASAKTPSPEARRPARRNRGALPPHLPRYEVVVDVGDKRDPCHGDAMHVIGKDAAPK